MPPDIKKRGFAIAQNGTIALVWILIWQFAAMLIGQEMLLASPAVVAGKLAALVRTAAFWRAVSFSISRVGLGFLMSLVCGSVLAVLSYKLRVAELFFRPVMEIAKAAPVVSYIILFLLFLSSRSLTVSASFVMGLPVIYTNIFEGLKSTDKKLLEMAAVFGVPPLKRIMYIYFSHLMPFLASACSLTLGLCWKSGIAAEVIGLPLGSIGENMYQAKIFVDSGTLLAWTAVVIAISFTFERLLLALLRKLMATVERL